MNILASLFGIFRQRGLVSSIKEGRSLAGFTVSAIIISLLGGLLYGFAAGAGLGVDTALKDAIKGGLIVALGLLFAVPIFWVSYRLLGREERLAQVTAVPLAFVATVSIILAVTAPVVFMLSVLAGFSPDVVYIHIIIVDLALIVGLYLAGTLIYQSFADPRRMIIPNVIGFLMTGVILVVLLSFLSPFLAPSATFSVGTDRLRDGLGLGVADKVAGALEAAASAERMSYRFQTTNENGDLVRDYTVTRAGNDYLIEIHTHAVPNEVFQSENRIWILDGQPYINFESGRVSQVENSAIASFTEPALPGAVFLLPEGFSNASWRAYESTGRYTATGTTPARSQATITLDAGTGRLSSMTLASADRGVSAETRVSELSTPDMDRAALQASLNQAIVVGSVDRSDASMEEFIQADTFFVVQYPRNWRHGVWDSSKREVQFTTSCGASEGCPSLTASVFELETGKSTQYYGEQRLKSLGLQPEYREIEVTKIALNDQSVGVVEYLSDRLEKGQVVTTHTIEFIFVGQDYRYHLEFSAPEANFENYRSLFEEMARNFIYLKDIG